jgi:hypothetical protein
MPALSDALRFVHDPGTTTEQLRRACVILEIDSAGDDDLLRSRLLAHLRERDAAEPVVCLNPNIPADF